MLTINGFASLQQFYKAARHALNEKMFERFFQLRDDWMNKAEDSSDAGSSEPPRDEPKRHPAYQFNMEVGAQFLVYDIMRIQSYKTGKSVQILKSDGNLLNLPLKQVMPNFRIKDLEGEFYQLRRWNSQEKDVKIDRGERVFGIDTFKFDFWIDPFLFTQVFTEPSRSYTSIPNRLPFTAINWNSGCIDLRPLKAYFKAVELFRQGFNTLYSIDVEPPKSFKVYAVEDDEFPRVLEPFDGCSIVVPVDWLSCLENLVPAKNDKVQEHSELKPRDVIIRLIESGEGSTKNDIKRKTQELFPEMSHRKFNQHWAMITDDRPELSRPGPKSKHRIETEI